MAQRNLHLLIIDPQNDFCDLPADYCPLDPLGGRFAPSLPVPGAHADMLALAALIDAGRAGLEAITVTLDSHQHLDIAHPTFWQDADGQGVAPFTQITAAELRAGRYLPRAPQWQVRAQSYLDALEAAGRYTHMVWPVHCEIGSWGHNIHHVLRLALNRWEEARTAIVAKVSKGENPLTEHYSAMQAEVPDPADAATQLNEALLARLRSAERVFIAGEAGSHCVRATTEHIVAHWPAAELGKLVLIEDCISPVSGFESAYAEFLAAMRERGVQLMNASEVRAELLDNAR
ncbi:cysteine hydrolase family protein [Uliginosibacterium aquaticum]|uniref:Cysteine hydrolase n=1 Tax=Uliginosibacterium aquaticum TaxID=2731212 RepID=A0ABX2IGK1_9RHOO|nr:cysteine hydrolase [Uliginosibacterium aquaticum]NSL55880.1 cysteine hydrolase [Uliginosibacterium aquaticum]